MGRCSGRTPEREQLGRGPVRPGNCDHTVRITQRQSTVLWQAVSQRVISVPQESSMTKMASTLFSNYIRIGMDVEGPSGLLSIGAALAPMFTAPECARVQQQAPQDQSLESLIGWLGGAARNALPRHRWPMYDNLLRKLLEQAQLTSLRRRGLGSNVGRTIIVPLSHIDASLRVSSTRNGQSMFQTRGADLA